MGIDLIGYINIAIFIINIIVGLVVLMSNRKKAVNISYFLCALTIGLWSLALFFYDNPMWFGSEIWLKIVYVISYLMTFAQISFVMVFNGGLSKKLRNIVFAILIPFFLYGLYVLFIQNDVILSAIHNIRTETVVATMGSSYIFYFLPILLSLVFLFTVQIVKGQQNTGLRRKQSVYYWVAGFLMIVPLVILDFVLPVVWGITDFYKYSTLGNILWSVIIAYSIYNTRFLDVRIVLGNILNYISKAIYIFVFLILYSYLQDKFASFVQDNIILFGLGYSLTFALILSWLSKKTEELIQKRYVYSRYNPVDELQRYSGMNSGELDLKKILDNTTTIVNDTMKAKSVLALVFDGRTMEVIGQSGLNFEEVESNATQIFMNNWENLNSNPILILSEIEEGQTSGKEMIDERKNAIIQFMKNYGIEIVLPFEFKSDLNGILLIGDKRDNSLYSSSDINFLQGIVQNGNVAISRALLYNQLQSFNQTLQQKVDLQTKELQVKIVELQEARQKETDMIDIMGHELRTPATIVKLNASLLDKFDKEIDSDPQAYKRYVDRIKIAVENEIKLINTLLSSAKLEGDKIVIDPEEINIREEIEMAIHGNEKEAKDKNLPIINNVDQNTPNVYADKARVVEVLNNLVSNGVKYTDTGSVTVSSTYNEVEVEITVADTGKGISKEDLPKLGQKFYRVSNYTESSDSGRVDIVRPGGTGLGLFVTFNLIRKMGGDVRVESELGKGSKFIFTLPRYNGQKDGFHKTQSNDMFEKLGLKK